MASLNYVCLVGNLTQDPTVRQLSSGTSVGELRLAINDSFTSKTSGEKVERTCFVDVEVWEKQAENCAKYLFKGSPVLIEGRLQLDQWESKEGEKRSRLKVRANRVQFLGAPRQGGAAAGAESTPAPSAPRGTTRQAPPPQDDGAQEFGPTAPEAGQPEEPF